MKYFLAIISSSFLLLASCQGQDGDGSTDPTGGVKANKAVKTYTLAKVAKDSAHKMASDQISAVMSSGKGEFVYVVSKAKKGLMVFDVEKNKWQDAFADWTKIPQANNRATLVDLSIDPINGFNTFDDGILLNIGNNKGLIVLKGVGEANASFYPQGANGFKNGGFTPFLVTKQDKSRFIYMTSASKNKTSEHRVAFRAYKEPPTVDNFVATAWDRTLMKKAGVKLDSDWHGRAQDANHNILLADKNSIRRIAAADVGVTGKVLDNGGKAIYKADNFMLDGKTKNDHINTIAVIDNKFLVVGLKSTNANDGGLAILDMSDSKAKWQHFGKGMGLSVDFIAQETVKQPEKTELAAIVVTDKGLLFMNNEAKMMEIVAGKGHLITAKFIDEHRADVTDYDKAIDGFAGDRVPEALKTYVSPAQDKNGVWYLAFPGKAADDGGIYKLDIKIDQVEEKTAAPVLP